MGFSNGRAALALALVCGLGIRTAIFLHTSSLGTPIEDERHFTELATSLADGRGFAWATGEPTSIRPPLYPAFVAAIWAVAGAKSLQAVRLAQVVLAVAMTGLVYAVGRRAFGAPTGRWAAAITFLYPTLIFFNFTILTETLFTCLLLGFVWLAIRALDTGRLAVAAACGAALGLAALTRSALWPLPIVLCPAMAVLAGGSYRKRFAVATAVLAGYVLVVGPWAARNTSLQGVVTVVDTMGGMNLRMGNYEHTPDDRMWDAVSLRGSRNWSHAISAEHPGQPFTEGQKDKWGQRKAVQFMLANPMTTIRRAGIKFADFWGLERELIAGVLHGLYSPPRWLARLTAVATIASYVTIVLGGVAAIWLARPAWPVHVLLLVPVIFLLGVHMLAFGHSRYHVPLMPVLSLYAAGLASRWVERPWAGGGWRSVAAALSMAVLIAVWLRQILLVDATRIRAFFDHA